MPDSRKVGTCSLTKILNKKVMKKEVIMSVKIIIARKFKEVPSPKNLQVIDELRIKYFEFLFLNRDATV